MSGTIETKTYTSTKAMDRDINRRLALGQTVINQGSYQPRSGVGRTLSLGFLGAAVFKPRTKFTVTYDTRHSRKKGGMKRPETLDPETRWVTRGHRPTGSAATTGARPLPWGEVSSDQ